MNRSGLVYLILVFVNDHSQREPIESLYTDIEKIGQNFRSFDGSFGSFKGRTVDED
jgi:hypothetical protein